MSTPLEDRLREVLGDVYAVERELGGGGMSRLFLAVERSLGRRVVVKLLPPEWTSEVSAQRFQREISLTAGLTHPHILPVLTAGMRDGLLYYVTPYLEGQSLRERLAAGPLPLEEALRVLGEISDALAFSHAQGVMHRDVKPANVLLQDGHAVLADFGVARALEVAAGESPLTATGLSVGTPGYMAPEQLAGDREVDARTDVYALAVLGYEMLAGQPPFAADRMSDMLAAHLTLTPRHLREIRPEVPGAAAEAIMLSLSKSPEQRPASAAEFRRRIARQSPAARPTRAVIGAAAFIVALGVAVYVGERARSAAGDGDGDGAAMLAGSNRAGDAGHARATPDSNVLIVLPFVVRGPPEVQHLRESIGDLLQMALDGVGGVQVANPPAVLRRLNRLADPTDATAARAMALELGAGRLIAGTIVATGPELRVRMEVFDAVRGSRQFPVEGRGEIAQLGALVDGLAAAILARKRISAAGEQRQDLGEYATKSPAALNAYLSGIQSERRGKRRLAADSLKSAILQDPDFGLAHLRLADVEGAQAGVSGVQGGLNAILRAAMDRMGRFPQRIQEMFSIRDAYSQGERARTLQLADQMAARYPRDADAAFQRADKYFHYGLSMGASREHVLAMFRAALALDDENPELLHHYWVLMSESDDSTAAAGAMRDCVAAVPTLCANVGFPIKFRGEDPGALLRGPDSLAQPGLSIMRIFPNDPALGLAFADVFAAAHSEPSRPPARRFNAYVVRYGVALTRGQYDLAWGYLDSAATVVPGAGLLQGYRKLHHIVTDTRRAEAEAPFRIPGVLLPAALEAWHAAVRHPMGSAPQAFESLERFAWPDSAMGAAFATAFRGILRLRAGDTANAVALLTQTHGNHKRRATGNRVLWPGTFLSLTTAQLQLARGHPEAAKLFLADAYPSNEVVPFLGWAEELRAGISLALGDSAAARRAFRNVVAIWKDGDAAVQPRVVAARSALARLDASVAISPAQ